MGKKGPQVQKMKNDMLYVWRRRWRRAGKGREGGKKEVQTNGYGGGKHTGRKREQNWKLYQLSRPAWRGKVPDVE